MVSVFFVGNSRCRGCFRPFLCNCMCFACKPRVSWAFVFYVRCCLVLQKFALATSKTVLQVVRIQSLEDYGKKNTFFKTLQWSKLQQKGTKKQPNVRLFGEFHFHLFRSHCLKSHVFHSQCLACLHYPFAFGLPFARRVHASCLH